MSVVPGDRRGTVDHERVCTLLPWPVCGTGHGGTHLLQQEQPQLWQSMWISQVQCTHEVLQGPRRCQWTLGSTGMIPPVHVQRNFTRASALKVHLVCVLLSSSASGRSSMHQKYGVRTCAQGERSSCGGGTTVPSHSPIHGRVPADTKLPRLRSTAYTHAGSNCSHCNWWCLQNNIKLWQSHHKLFSG